MNINKSKTKTKSKKIYWIVFFALICVILWVFVGIDFNFSNKTAILQQAQSLWRQQDIFDYNIVIHFRNSNYVADIEFEVRDGQVVTIYDHGNPLQNEEKIEISSIYLNSYFASQFPSTTLENYEITNLFEFIDSEINPYTNYSIISLCTTEPQYQISYDTEYGFPNQVLYSNCPNWDFGLGLMCPIISHCQSGFSIVNFEEK